MRFIIIIALVYIFYRALKSWMQKNTSISGSGDDGQTSGKVADVMVKDPYCQVYFPQRKGIRLRQDGQDILFCSQECRDKYIAERNTTEK